MRKIKWTIRIFLIIVLGTFFHYVLPQHDTVRIVSTSLYSSEFSAWNRMFYAQTDSGNADTQSRDVRLIQGFHFDGDADQSNDDVSVYRNEDTGWIWPPYFKFDSSDLQTEAADQVSTAAAPRWVSITHYGWRIPFLSIYPNAVGIHPVADPNAFTIPYFNIAFFIVLAAGLLFLRSMWRQFRERSVDPVLETASDKWDEVEAGVSERRSRFGRWFDSWRAKPRR